MRPIKCNMKNVKGFAFMYLMFYRLGSEIYRLAFHISAGDLGNKSITHTQWFLPDKLMTSMNRPAFVLWVAVQSPNECVSHSSYIVCLCSSFHLHEMGLCIRSLCVCVWVSDGDISHACSTHTRSYLIISEGIKLEWAAIFDCEKTVELFTHPRTICKHMKFTIAWMHLSLGFSLFRHKYT